MIEQSTNKAKCEVKDCKNFATNYIPAKGRVGKFFICDECLKTMTDSVIAKRTPQSPKNTIKKILDKKAQEQY